MILVLSHIMEPFQVSVLMLFAQSFAEGFWRSWLSLDDGYTQLVSKY